MKSYDFEAALSTRPKRVIPSSYVFHPSRLSKDILLADASARELRRRVGERQSLSNYYKSDTFYEKQGYLFKPITESDRNTQKMLSKYNEDNQSILDTLAKNTTALTSTLDKNTTFMETLNNLVNSRNEPTVSNVSEPTVSEAPSTVDRDVVQDIYSNRSPSKVYFEIVIDGDRCGTFPAGEDLTVYWKQHYVRFLPNNSQTYTALEAVNMNEVRQYPLTADFTKVCLENITIETVKSQYMSMFDFLFGDELREAYNDFITKVNPDNALIFWKWYSSSKKFRDWIVPQYMINMHKVKTFIDKIDSESDSDSDSGSEAASQNEEQERKITEESEKPFGAVTKKRGEGIYKYIVISPNVKDRMNRIKVLLGSRNAGNNVGIEEFTTILDSLLKDNKINKVRYQSFMKIWNSK